MNVYLYVCLDSEGWVHSGLTAARGRNEVMEDIRGTFGEVTHVMVDYVPELRPVWDETETYLLRFERVGEQSGEA